MKITNDERGIVVDITDVEIVLLNKVIPNHIGYMPKVYRKRNMNLCIVQDLLGHGCGYSEAICKALGVDPDSYIWEIEK